MFFIVFLVTVSFLKSHVFIYITVDLKYGSMVMNFEFGCLTFLIPLLLLLLLLLLWLWLLLFLNLLEWLFFVVMIRLGCD